MSKKNPSASAVQAKKKPGKIDVKKTLTVLAVVILLIAVAAFVDHIIRNPKCEDETAALNVAIQKILPSLDELGPDDPFSMESLERITLEGKAYYPVRICRVEAGDSETEVALIYVRESNSKPFIKDSVSGQLIPYGE